MCKLLHNSDFTKGKYMEIRSFGVGGRMRECERLLRSSLSLGGGRLILLPIPTTRDNKYISGTDVSISSAASLIGKDTAVVGYGIPPEIRSQAESVGALLFDAGQDENFLLENARVTANGAVGYILTHSTKDVGDMRLGIVGYGRIGRELMRLFLLLGAEITMFTARKSVAIELGEMGIAARVIDADTDFSGLDMLINTTPKRQIDESALPRGIDIIDLASGSIFEPSARLTKLSSIPDAFYPETAGRLYAEAALSFLEREGKI